MHVEDVPHGQEAKNKQNIHTFESYKIALHKSYDKELRFSLLFSFMEFEKRFWLEFSSMKVQMYKSKICELRAHAQPSSINSPVAVFLLKVEFPDYCDICCRVTKGLWRNQVWTSARSSFFVLKREWTFEIRAYSGNRQKWPLGFFDFRKICNWGLDSILDTGLVTWARLETDLIRAGAGRRPRRAQEILARTNSKRIVVASPSRAPSWQGGYRPPAPPLRAFGQDIHETKWRYDYIGKYWKLYYIEIFEIWKILFHWEYCHSEIFEIFQVGLNLKSQNFPCASIFIKF